MTNLNDFIEFLALGNAIKFKGKCNSKSLIGKILAKFPEEKKEMKKLMEKINETCEKINKLDLEKQQKEIGKFSDFKNDKNDCEKKRELDKIKSLIFDFDGVIENTFELYFDIVKRRRPKITRQDFREKHYGNIFETKEYEAKVENPQIDFNKESFEKFKELKIDERIKENLVEFSKKYKLFIVSSSPHDRVFLYLKNNKIDNLFEEILDESFHKSKVEKFKYIFEKFKYKNDEVVFITDTIGDVLEADRFNLKTICLTNGFNEKSQIIKFSNPFFLADEFIEIGNKIKTLERILNFSEIKNDEKKQYCFRFSPAPSGHLHIGHMFNILYNYIYKKKYGGKFILRIEDTNPENIDIQNYLAIIEDVKFLTNGEIDEIYYQSKRIDIYHKYLKESIKKGFAYFDFSNEEDKKDEDISKLETRSFLKYRDTNIEENLKIFENVLNKKYSGGEVVLRFKGDLKSKNPALWDFSVARINYSRHQILEDKCHFWPMYNFACAIDDSLMEVSHIIRGKDGEVNAIKQDMVKDALNLEKSDYIHIGRVQFSDLNLSKSKISKQIENGEIDNYLDPRSFSIKSFQNRGFLSESFFDYVLEKGISKRDSKISKNEFLKCLDFFNKQLIDEKSNRLFCVKKPINLEIKNYFEMSKKLINEKIIGTNQDELIDVFDENNNLIEVGVKREEFKKRNLIKRAVDIWIVDKNNNLLLEKRSKYKKSFPLKLSKTAGGVVGSEEDVIKSLIREVKEEVGVILEENMIKKNNPKLLDFGNNDMEWNYCFFIKLDLTKEDLIIQEEEIEEIVQIPLNKFKDFLKVNRKEIVPTDDKYFDKKFFLELEKLKNEKPQKVCFVKKNKNIIEIQLEKYPGNKNRGFRNLEIEKEIFIEENDFSKLKTNDIFRLMHLGNFKYLGNEKIEFISKEYDKNLSIKGNIHFVCKFEEVKVFNENNKTDICFLEENNNLEEGDTCQFERIGFFKLTKNCCSGYKKFRFICR